MSVKFHSRILAKIKEQNDCNRPFKQLETLAPLVADKTAALLVKVSMARGLAHGICCPRLWLL
ncbi:MAG: hypothetical protein AAB354_04845, partial [candidate division KSB1 bacterium]